MGRMPSAERRQQLVEAAIRAMTRDGVARTTTRSICAEAGVSLSVFHYCFDSKQALLEAVIATTTEHSVTPVASAVAPATGPATGVRATFRGALQGYWEHVAAHPAEHMLTYELTQYALREPGLEHLAQRQYEQYTAAASALIELVEAELGLKFRMPAEALARYLAVLVDGFTLNYLVLGDDQSAAAVLDSVTDHLVSLVAD